MNWPTPVGMDSQLTTSDDDRRAGSQPRFTPAANVHTANVGTTIRMPLTAALTNRLTGVPVILAAQIHTRNGSSTAAVAFTANASVTKKNPLRYRPSRTSTQPAVIRPTISRSL